MFSSFSPRRIHEKIFFRTFCRLVIIIVFISPPDINCQTKSQRFYLYSMDRRRLIDVDCALGRKEVYENCVIRTRDECWAFGPPNLNTEYPHEYVHLMKLEYYSSHDKRRPEREQRRTTLKPFSSSFSRLDFSLAVHPKRKDHLLYKLG